MAEKPPTIDNITDSQGLIKNKLRACLHGGEPARATGLARIAEI